MTPGPDEVHLWRWPLDVPAGDLASARAELDPDERARADRFHFALDRSRFIVARGGLRARLGSILGRSPESLAFAYGKFGKPALEVQGEPDLRFNLSHSDGLAVLAVAIGFDLGVDVETVRDIDVDRLAAITFSASETAQLGSLLAAERQAGFYRCWTRKEAYVKALGRGFDLPLASFTVSLAPSQPARLLEVKGEPDEAVRWSIAHLEPRPGYVGAVAARRNGWRIVERE